MRKPFIYAFLLTLFILCQNICYAQQRPAIQWQKSLGGTRDDKANDILLNTDGTMVIVGWSKSNDGDVTGHHGATTVADAWVAKLDGNGNLLWQKSIGGSGDDQFNSVIATGDGGYLCIGYSNSSDGDIALNNGSSDFLLVKISSTGAIVWEQTYGGSKSDIAASGVSTTDGGFAIIGTSFSDDGDVQSGVYGRTVSDAWIIKTDAAGIAVWEKCLYNGDGSGDNKGFCIMETPDQNLLAYISGSTFYEYTYDTQIFRVNQTPGMLYAMDKTTGASSFKLNTGGDANYSMCKSNNGKYYFAFQNNSELPPPFNCSNIYSIIANSTNLTAINGSQEVGYYDCFLSSFNSTKTFATGNGIAALSDGSVAVVGNLEENYGQRRDAILVLSSNGATFFYGYGINSFFPSGFNSIKVFQSGDEYVVAGFSGGNGGDVSGNHGGSDCWVVRLMNSNKITGNVFVDNNNNGLKDAGEPGFDKATIKSAKYGVSQYTIPTNGYYENFVDTGTYRTTIQIHKPYYTTTNAGELSTFTAYKGRDTINFPVKPIPGIRDYAIGLSPLDNPRPGLSQGYVLTYANRGTDTLINSQVRFIKDPRTSLAYANPTVSAISGDTLMWNIADVLPDSTGIIRFSLQIAPIPQLGIGDTIYCSVYIDSTGDVSPRDNYGLLRQETRGSFDPNDKREVHGGYISPLEMTAEKYLTYTIRFQNTGNEAAANIVVRDTLDTRLDGGSIEMVSASHTYKINIKNGKYISWTFNNINLADSFSNEPQSHGYITYRIKPLPGFVTGDTIRNTAFIYFDFNPPVVTNTELTIFKPEKSVWTGAISTAWENPLNWSNGKVPDKGTDVYINGGTPNNPEINSAAFCRIIFVNPTAKVKVNTGKTLTVGGEFIQRIP